MPSFRPTRGTTGKPFRPRTRAWLLGGLVLVAGCPSLFLSHDPSSEARRALEGLSRTGLELASTPHPVHFNKLELSEIEVDGQDPPTVLFHVVATGTYGEAALGYYGSERVTFRRVDGKLAPPESWLPKLEGVLRALVARDAAVEARSVVGLFDLAAPEGSAELLQRSGPASPAELAPLAPDGKTESISIRIDGTHAQVSASGPGATSCHVAVLQWGQGKAPVGDSWRFVTGLL